MRRVLAVLACCCVLSGAVFAVPTDGAVGVVPNATANPTPTTNSTAYLTVPAGALETADYRRATLGITGTLVLDARGLNGRFEQLRLGERFDATAATGARRAQLGATAARIETRIDRLRERQTTAIRGYNNGTLSPRQFVVELARIDTTAGRLGTAAGDVERRASSIPRSFIDGQPAVNWANNRRVELGPLQSPVRQRIVETLRGENTVNVNETAPTGLRPLGSTRSVRVDALRLYVETTRRGVVLAMVDDGIYHREAYLPGARNATANGVAGIGDALDRVAERYPWASNNSGAKTSYGARRAGIYRFTLFHGHGRLTTYLDGDSGGVFAEQQRKSLMNVPTAPSVTRETGGLRLRMNRTHPTGPLELALSTTDGEPIDGRIRIGNRSVRRTGADGRLWTIAPHGNDTVAARANDETVRVATNATGETTRAAVTDGPA